MISLISVKSRAANVRQLRGIARRALHEANLTNLGLINRWFFINCLERINKRLVHLGLRMRSLCLRTLKRAATALACAPAAKLLDSTCRS
jgi:hypothetical protein